MSQSRRSSLDSYTAGPPAGLSQLKVRLQRVHDDLSRGTNKFYAQTRTTEQLDNEKQALDSILGKVEVLELAMHSLATSQRFNDREQETIRSKVEVVKRELLACTRDVGAQVFIAKVRPDRWNHFHSSAHQRSGALTRCAFRSCAAGRRGYNCRFGASEDGP